MTEQTPGSDARPTPPGEQRPGYAAPAPFPTYAQPAYAHPAYPPYGYYPYYAHWYGQAYTQPPTPVERPARKGGQAIFYAVTAALAVGLTVGALALAAAAPALVDHVPSADSLGFTSLYSSNLANDTSSLTNDTANWDQGHNCSFDDGGLHADGSLDADNGAVCTFQPSAKGNLTGSGFLLTVQVAPAMNVASEQIACVLITSQTSTNGYALLFDQTGGYEALNPTTDSCGSGGTVPGTSVAWHSDGYEANTIALWYSASAQSLTVYSNGQRLNSIFLDNTGPFTLALGAPANAEAVYTSAALAGTQGAS